MIAAGGSYRRWADGIFHPFRPSFRKPPGFVGYSHWRVTTKADSRRRVVVPWRNPDRTVQDKPDGSIKLTLLKAPEPVDRPAKVTFVKEGRFTVGVLDRPINEEALKEALAEFP